VVRVPFLVLVIAMDVSLQHGYIFIGRENVHHVVAIAGKPLPFRLQIEQGPVSEDDNGSHFRKAGKVLLQPGQLLRPDLGLRSRDVIERDEVDPAMIERVVGFLEKLAVELSAVQAGVVLAWNVHHFADLHAAGNLLKLLHALRVHIFPRCHG
jgi:hypothetical protein